MTAREALKASSRETVYTDGGEKILSLKPGSRPVRFSTASPNADLKVSTPVRQASMTIAMAKR
jgi:hypothetical protein